MRLLPGLLVVFIVALALRLPDLGQRPFHNDEAVNAIKFRDLWEKGQYRYDPDEHHGPTLHYGMLLLARLTGAPGFNEFSEARFRVLTVLVGAGLILLLGLTADGLGRMGTFWAAMLTAISPSMVYFSRYFIHELLLVFAAFLTIGAGWRYTRKRGMGWALLVGVGLALMHATKETFVINLFAMAGALGVCWGWRRWVESGPAHQPAIRIAGRDLAIMLGTWAVIATVLFSSFFSNASGPLDSLRTYLPWLHRAGGESPHIHPWPFFFERLFWFKSGLAMPWTELAILALALVGTWGAFARRALAGDGSAGLVRFLALYGAAQFVAYTLISYKTPWCILGAEHAMILVAGFGVSVLWRLAARRRQRLAVAGIVGLALVQLTWQAYALSFRYASDPHNPWVYGHTSADIANLVERCHRLADVSEAGYDTLVQVACQDDDYWPLPYELRQFHKVGWYGVVPDRFVAPIVVVSSSLRHGLDQNEDYVMAGFYQLRPNVFLELYVERTLWQAFLARQGSRDSDGG